MATLTIRDVPEATVRNLKARAERTHRSLQREMLLILEESISSSVISEPQPQYRVEPPARVPTTAHGSTTAAPTREFLSIEQLWERGRSMGLSTPDESVEIIRKLRDQRFGR